MTIGYIRPDVPIRTSFTAMLGAFTEAGVWSCSFYHGPLSFIKSMDLLRRLSCSSVMYHPSYSP